MFVTVMAYKVSHKRRANDGNFAYVLYGMDNYGIRKKKEKILKQTRLTSVQWWMCVRMNFFGSYLDGIDNQFVRYAHARVNGYVFCFFLLYSFDLSEHFKRDVKKF